MLDFLFIFLLYLYSAEGFFLTLSVFWTNQALVNASGFTMLMTLTLLNLIHVPFRLIGIKSCQSNQVLEHAELHLSVSKHWKPDFNKHAVRLLHCVKTVLLSCFLFKHLWKCSLHVTQSLNTEHTQWHEPFLSQHIKATVHYTPGSFIRWENDGQP